MTIKSSKRKVVAELPAKAGITPLVIELIADEMTGSSAVTIKLVGGPCEEEFSDRPIIEAFDGSELVAGGGGTLEFEAPGPGLSDLTWESVLFPYQLVHSSQIQALLCDGADAYVAELRVFPKVVYTIAISLPGLTMSRARTVNQEGDLRLRSAKSELTWDGSFDVKVGRRKFHLGDDFKESLDRLCDFVALGEEFFGLVDEVIATASGGRPPIKAKISALSIKAKAEFSNDERADGLDLDYKLDLSLRFDPLLRAAVRLDILESVLLVMSENPVGRVLKWAYDKSIANPADPPLQVFFELAGQIEGGVTWKKAFGDPGWKTEEDFKGIIEGKLWGKAEGAVRCCVVSAGASVKASAKTSAWVKIFTESERPVGEISAQVGHDGVTFTAATAITYYGRASSAHVSHPGDAAAPEDAPAYFEYEWFAPVTKPSEDDAYHYTFWKQPR
ncbi:MAG: hypothetical protein ABI647_20170 [Gemmatimonadota bacterium]